MSFYKCGHDSEPLFVTQDSIKNILFLFEYDHWRTTNGYDGDKLSCFRCWRQGRVEEAVVEAL